MRIHEIVARLTPALADERQIEFVSTEQKTKGVPVPVLIILLMLKATPQTHG